MEADRFYRHMLKLFKDEKNPETRNEKIFQDFLAALPALPENMDEDLFWDLADIFNLTDMENREDFQEAVILLTKVIELFNMEYGATEGELPEKAWESIRDTANEYALDLDEDLLNYLMIEIVNQGKI